MYKNPLEILFKKQVMIWGQDWDPDSVSSLDPDGWMICDPQRKKLREQSRERKFNF